MKPLLKVEQAALYVGLSKHTLNKMRCFAGGPRFVRTGKRSVAYHPDDLDHWIAENKHASTAEYETRGGRRRR